MMLSKAESRNGGGDGSSNSGQLLRDIEAISKALYLHKTPQKALISPSSGRSKSVEKPRLSESKSSLNPRSFNETVTFKDKKSSSAWNWKKPLKALAHIGRQKLNICFFLHVHSIEGLPPSFNGMNLSVHWKRKDAVLRTRASKVLKGIAKFDDNLMHKCSVYGTRSGPYHAAKYEIKLFLIYASIIGAPGINMGKQWVDLTTLLPLSLEELEGEKSTGKWTTSYKLEGKAKGATLNVSFGFSVLRDNFSESRSNMSGSDLVNMVHDRSAVGPETGFGQTNSHGILQRLESVPCDLNHQPPLSSQSVDAKSYHDVSSNLGLELSRSINFLYEKLDEVNWQNTEKPDVLSGHMQQLKPKFHLEFENDEADRGNEYDIEFTVVEQGIEMEQMEPEQDGVQTTDGSAIETIDLDEIIKDDDIALDEETEFHSEGNIFHGHVDEVLVDDCKHEENSASRKGSIMEDLESDFNNQLISESEKLEYQLAMSKFLENENYMETKSNYKANKVEKKSFSLDEFTTSVASDFLNMLGIEHSPFGLSSDSEPESPRERLLREFEKEAIASGSFIIDFDGNTEHEELGRIAQAGSSYEDLSDDLDLSLVIQAAEQEHWRASQLLSGRRVKVLEDLETEALMREWGLQEEAFQNSPRYCSDGFGSPIELLPEKKVELPPLGDGFGPFIHTKDGGCLRSMNPSLFRNSKNAGSLVMQVSCPVVLPAELGSDIMEILQYLASVGITKLSLLTNKLMPLEDITGKMLQQIAEDITERKAPLRHESLFGKDPINWRKEVEGVCSHRFFSNIKSSLIGSEVGWEYVSLEDLAPLAMNKIDAMSIEGLRIQSGMSEEAAPSSISPQSPGKMLAFEGKNANLVGFLSLGGAELHQLDAKDADSGADGLLSHAITLEEWLRLDAGFISEEDQVDEHTIRILAAHRAKCIDFNGRFTGDIKWGTAFGGKHGLLGNNLTVVLKILLRDPLRNFEPVGAPMLALIQVERAFIHPMSKVYGSVLERGTNEEDDHEWIQYKKSDCLGFKISEVHVSGLNTEPGKTQHWVTKTQQQSGTRWLVASGMSKSYKQPFSKSKAIVLAYPQVIRKVEAGDILWSISSQAKDTETSWKELAGFVPHVRNPNVIFPG
ncbi:protein PLASTID MOVEMENT IMPAIRED RELATED [Salix suchowensis]|nr:protein PLASTID MOVEMENT IMPAIRED RELATED [Salix suchowensis]